MFKTPGNRQPLSALHTIHGRTVGLAFFDNNGVSDNDRIVNYGCVLLFRPICVRTCVRAIVAPAPLFARERAGVCVVLTVPRKLP